MKITTYAIPGLAYLVMAIAVGLLAAATGTDTLVEGIVLGLVLGIGLSLMHTLVDATFDPNTPQPWVWIAINGTYHAPRNPHRGDRRRGLARTSLPSSRA